MGNGLRARLLVEVELRTSDTQTTPFLRCGVYGYMEEVAFAETCETARIAGYAINGWTHSL